MLIIAAAVLGLVSLAPRAHAQTEAKTNLACDAAVERMIEIVTEASTRFRHNYVVMSHGEQLKFVRHFSETLDDSTDDVGHLAAPRRRAGLPQPGCHGQAFQGSSKAGEAFLWMPYESGTVLLPLLPTSEAKRRACSCASVVETVSRCFRDASHYHVVAALPGGADGTLRKVSFSQAIELARDVDRADAARRA